MQATGSDRSAREARDGAVAIWQGLVRGALKHSLNKFRPELVDAIVQRMEIPDSRVFQISPAEFESLAKHFEDALNDNSIGSAEIRQVISKG